MTPSQSEDSEQVTPTAARLAVTDPFADWPKDEVAAVDERTTLVGFLDYQRAVLARKAAGLSDAQARIAACPPSDLTALFGTCPKSSAGGHNVA